LAFFICLLWTASARAQGTLMLSWRQTDPARDGVALPLRNGDTLRIVTEWNRDSLDISIDCGAISSGTTQVERIAARQYLIVHQIPLDRPGRDAANLPVVITASAPGDSAAVIDSSPRVCISNHPPTPSRVFLVNPPPFGYTARDSVRIASKWASPDSTELLVTGDFSAIQPNFKPESVRLRFLSGTAFGDSPDAVYYEVSYRIPGTLFSVDEPDGRVHDGKGFIIPIVATDPGCGLTEDRSISIDLDSTPPSAAPVLDPLPSETTMDSLLIGGTAAAAVRVAINDNGEITRIPVDTLTHRFEGWIHLQGLPDRQHRIYGKSEDAVGNGSTPSPTYLITQVATPGFIIPRPYRRDRTIVFRRPTGFRDLEIRLFDLEGSCLRRWTSENNLDFRFEWDGLDAKGVRAGQGLYLLRASWIGALDGRTHDETTTIVLRD